MAPKDKKGGDKGKAAAKQKVADDKTFGLKNKSKSAKVQKYVQTVTKQVTHDPLQGKRPDDLRKEKKRAEEERQKELAALFAVAIKQPKLPPGVDPKSVLCEFFRHNQCTKGFKCKYSHDISVERKGHKIDLYSDRRGAEEEEGMDDWDEETLKQAVAQKHGNEKVTNRTEIICKFFLDAVERRQYGWFWKCPNGDECKYRHALPPGYVLKSQMKELLEEEAKNQRDVADVIEEERAKVDAKTPITQKVFLQWRHKKIEQKALAAAEVEAERQRKGILNGREIFMQDGFQAVDDAGAADEYDREGAAVAEEAAIQEMVEEAQKRLREAQAASAAAPASSSDPSSSAAPSSSSAPAGPSSSTVSTTLQLQDDDKQLFMDDTDDDDDDDDLDLDALEQQVKAAHVSG